MRATGPPGRGTTSWAGPAGSACLGCDLSSHTPQACPQTPLHTAGAPGDTFWTLGKRDISQANARTAVTRYVSLDHV